MATANLSAQTSPASTLRSIIARHPLVTFFALCFALTWGLGLVIIAGGHGLLPFAVPSVPLFYLGVYAPTIAALVVGGVTGGPAGLRAVLAGWTRWRVRPAWYLLAVALFPVLGLVAVGLYAARGGVVAIQPAAPAALAALFIIGATLGPIGEEAGWRGFALPRLQARYGPVGASLVLGAIWGGWHGILWAIPGTGQSAYPFLVFVLATIAQQVIFTWLYNKTGGEPARAGLPALQREHDAHPQWHPRESCHPGRSSISRSHSCASWPSPSWWPREDGSPLRSAGESG